MSTHHYFEDGSEIRGLWYGCCDEDHDKVLFVTAVEIETRRVVRIEGGCPVCAARYARRLEESE